LSYEDFADRVEVDDFLKESEHLVALVRVGEEGEAGATSVCR
jgi:hypothetical protein